MTKNKILVDETPTTTTTFYNPFEPLMGYFKSPIAWLYVVLLIALLILKNINGMGKKNVLANARFARASEIRKGAKKGERQIIEGKANRAALQLEHLTLPDLQPAFAIFGRSRGGKTRSIGHPAVMNAIDQGWTNLVLTVKGDMFRFHAAYALAMGYEVYVYAPGTKYSDGFNFLKLMEDENDAKTAEEIARVFDANFGKPGEKKDSFFSPQGVAALRLMFMLAKSSPYKDLLSAWKFLSLPNIAERLEAASRHGGLSTWLEEAATAIRSLADIGETVGGILATAMTHFQRIVDRSILPCLLNDTIPTELSGKQIVFFQIDENAVSATAPLVAAAIHMLVTRNANAKICRQNTLGLFLEEFDSIVFPDIKTYITRFAEYGMVTMISTQSEAQVEEIYGNKMTKSILSSCGTKIYFNVAHPETAANISRALGKKQIEYKTESVTRGKGTTRNTNEHIQAVPLVHDREINEQDVGECIIMGSSGFNYRPYKTKIKIDKRNDDQWEKNEQIWFEKIQPHREKQIAAITEDLEIAIINRKEIAEATLLTNSEWKLVTSNAA